MIVTIDGPAGSGKSSAARGLAARVGFEVLDTGASYRAVALAVIRSGKPNPPSAELDVLLARLCIEMPPGRVLLNGEDITQAIRTQEVSQVASCLAEFPAVRQFLVALQRQIASGRNVISEGRDQGTVVFPDAARKFFFQADPAERARRRLKELRERGNKSATLESVLAEQEQRDRRDAGRDLAPMVPAPGAIVIDTTHLTLEQVLDRLEREVRSCLQDA